MMRPNFVRHHRLPPSEPDGERHGRDRAEAVPSAPSPTGVSLPAALPTAGSADRSPRDPANRIGRADGLTLTLASHEYSPGSGREPHLLRPKPGYSMTRTGRAGLLRG